jgi:citrate synthase
MWRSSITEIAPDVIHLRGYPIERLIGNITFPATIWLMTRGELPSAEQVSLLETVLDAGVDQGPLAPSLAIARMVATCGVGINNAMASAVNVLGNAHGGAGANAWNFWPISSPRPSRAPILTRGHLTPSTSFRHRMVVTCRDSVIASTKLT